MRMRITEFKLLVIPIQMLNYYLIANFGRHAFGDIRRHTKQVEGTCKLEQ